MRYIILTGLFFVVLAPAAPAQAGLFDFLFPSLAKKDPNLYETLEAPFADIPDEERAERQERTQRELLDIRLPENAVPLEQPHRQKKQVGLYVSEMVVQALSFENENFKQDIIENLKMFSTEGQSQYKAFLKDKNIAEVLQSQKYYIRSYAPNTPLLMNAAPLEGRYRWAFEVPVVLSYMDRSAVDYQRAEATNQKMMISVQVGRHLGVDPERGILIEKWDAKVVKLDQ